MKHVFRVHFSAVILKKMNWQSTKHWDYDTGRIQRIGSEENG